MFTITLLTAVALSAVAAYFSVIGLIAIFAAAPLSIAVMGGVLEAAKLVTASWLYRNWTVAPRTIKYYFTVAVVVLSLITSMGIFGYLSKAHMDQALPSGEVQAKVQLFDEKIKVARDNIEANRTALKQLDSVVDQVIARSSTEESAQKAAQIRRSQQRERTRLLEEIQVEQRKISQLNEERAPFASELRKVEAEVGPLKYIAALIYGDNPDTNTLEKAVRWVIIILVFVFDPLAILLLIAANITFNQLKKPDPIPDPPIQEKATEFSYPEDTPKEKWSDEMYQRVKQDPKNVRIERSRIHSIPKEIIDKVFRK